MTPEIKELLERAKLSEKAAANLLRDGFANFAASRAYYSVFYIAQALLLSKGLSFSSHAAYRDFLSFSNSVNLTPRIISPSSLAAFCMSHRVD